MIRYRLIRSLEYNACFTTDAVAADLPSAFVDANAPLIASIYGDFTCDEDPHDCEVMRHPPVDAFAIGGFSSTGTSLFVHFHTQETATTISGDSYMVSEGWSLSWMFSTAGAPCSMDDVDSPAFGNIGSCTANTMRTGETCEFGCNAGTAPSTAASSDVWRTLRTTD